MFFRFLGLGRLAELAELAESADEVPNQQTLGVDPGKVLIFKDTLVCLRLSSLTKIDLLYSLFIF